MAGLSALFLIDADCSFVTKATRPEAVDIEVANSVSQYVVITKYRSSNSLRSGSGIVGNNEPIA